jgi:mRNA interferase MazF
VNRGEVRWYTFRPPDKRRPVLILTRDSALDVLTGITIAPITTTIRHIPTEVLLTPTEDGVLTESVINLDNLQTVPKAKVGGLITILSPEKIEAVEQAICFALGMDHLL